MRFRFTLAVFVFVVLRTIGANAQADSYHQGVADWQSLQAWFEAQSGDRRAGADFWAANRSRAGHQSCAEAAGDFSGDKSAFIAGCQDAKQRLDPIDAKRLSDQEYRDGFNEGTEQLPAGPSTTGAPTTIAAEPSQTRVPAAAAAPTTKIVPPTTTYQPTRPAMYQSPAYNAEIDQTTPIVLIVGALLVIGGIFLYFLVKSRKNKHRERILKRVSDTIEYNVSLHKRALRRKRFQTLLHDAYGNLVWDPWIKEISYFVNTILDPTVRALGYEEYVTFTAIRPAIAMLIDGLVEKEASLGETISFGPNLTPTDYEQFCAEQLRLSGWKATTTKATGDQGSDIIAEKSGLRLVVQCKLYNHPVGNKAVQEVAAARFHEQADYAAVVTNTRYTPAAQQLAKTNDVKLLHHSDLQDIDQYLEFGETTPHGYPS